MKSLVLDTFRDKTTRTLLRGNVMDESEKKIVLRVLKYISNTRNLNTPLDNIIKSSENFDDIKSKIDGCKTDECLFANAVLTYHIYPKSLLMTTMAIHSRTKPLESKDAWYDNFTLNSYLLQLTTITYENFDSGSNVSYSISNPGRNLINKDVNLDSPNKLLEHFGNRYRVFVETGDDITPEMSAEKALEILDTLNLKYPYHTGCTHGCDVFWIPDKSVSIHDIAQFTKRYPESVVGYILNTKSYKSGRGQHWIAMLYKFNQCYLICSQGSNFNAFDTYAKLMTELGNENFGVQYSGTVFQHDGSNCGLYSVLSNLVFMILLDKANRENEKIDLYNVATYIGDNAKNIDNKGIYNLKKKLTGY